MTINFGPAAGSGLDGRGRSGSGFFVRPLSHQRDDDRIADTGVLQLLQRCGVNREHAAIHLDQRQQDVIAQAGFRQLDEVADGEGVGAAALARAQEAAVQDEQDSDAWREPPRIRLHL